MILLVHFKVCRKFSTFLELDYDTPWDNRHISRDMKKRLRLAKDATLVRKSIRRLKETFRRTTKLSQVPLVDSVSDVNDAASDVIDADAECVHSPLDGTPRRASSISVVEDGLTVDCAATGRQNLSTPRRLNLSFPESENGVSGFEPEVDSLSVESGPLSSDSCCSEGTDSEGEEVESTPEYVQRRDDEGKDRVVFQFWL